MKHCAFALTSILAMLWAQRLQADTKKICQDHAYAEPEKCQSGALAWYNQQLDAHERPDCILAVRGESQKTVSNGNV